MKSKCQSVVRSIAIVAAVMASGAAFGQSRHSAIVSKDVQRFSMGKSSFVPARIVTTSLPLTQKSVQLIGRRFSEPEVVQVKMTGMPPYVISKGVARMQYQHRSKK
jgi:hypothetical protein